MTATNVCGVVIDKFTQSTTASGSTKTLTTVDNNNQVILLDTATGSTVTLPAATGTGAKFKFVVSVLATTANHIVKVANATDVIQGVLPIEYTTGNVTLTFATNASADTITLNRTTTGSVSIGEWLELQDIASGVWSLSGILTASSSPVTPFTATV